MSTAVVLPMAIVVAAGLAALAWWVSGRSRAGVQVSLAERERAENDLKALRQHRPHSSAPLGPLGQP